MKDIKCPSCGKTFRIDPSSFQEILLQIKDKEFNNQIEERLKLAEEDKNKGIEIAKQELKINIKDENIKHLTQCSRLLDEILNRKPNKHLPYVGAAAFSHKGGMHVSAVQKDPKTYEHIDPKEVGNVRNIVISDQAGQSNILSRLGTIGIDIKKNDPKIKELLDEVKGREFIGYSYDGADASFELLARRIVGEIPRYLIIKAYDVSVKKNSSG